MKNTVIIQNVVAYIKKIMDQRGLKPRSLSALCEEKGGREGYVAPKTINNMITKPSSTTISTLLKVCDGLDLNLASILHAIEIAKTTENAKQNRLVHNINDSAYNGYTGTYHVFFLPTSADPEDHTDKTLIHGTLQLGDLYSVNECTAVLDIDSGDLTAEGEPFTKHYEGTLVYSQNSMMFCRLVCTAYGDMWFLVFDHGNLNNKELACVIGCAATASSGRIRHPAIHRFCLCNKQQYPEIDADTKKLIQGLLRIQNGRIFITKENVDAFLQRDDLDPTFRLNLENHLNIAREYYALPKGVLKNDVELSVFSKTIAELCELSALEKTYHIRHSDDRELTSILKHSLSTESEVHK